MGAPNPRLPHPGDAASDPTLPPVPLASRGPASVGAPPVELRPPVAPAPPVAPPVLDAPPALDVLLAVVTCVAPVSRPVDVVAFEPMPGLSRQLVASATQFEH